MPAETIEVKIQLIVGDSTPRKFHIQIPMLETDPPRPALRNSDVLELLVGSLGDYQADIDRIAEKRRLLVENPPEDVDLEKEFPGFPWNELGRRHLENSGDASDETTSLPNDPPDDQPSER